VTRTNRAGKSLLSEVAAANSLLLGSPVALVEREGNEYLAERVLARCETEGLSRRSISRKRTARDGVVTTQMWRRARKARATSRATTRKDRA
jgi:hypothetical protein